MNEYPRRICREQRKTAAVFMHFFRCFSAVIRNSGKLFQAVESAVEIRTENPT